MKNRVLLLAAVTAASLTVAACETTPIPGPPPRVAPGPPPPPPPPPTPAEEFAWSTVRGNNTLIVSVLYQPAATQTWDCAGLAEALMPETSYSRGRMMTLYGSAERALRPTAEVRARSAANPDTESARFVRSTTCDAQGNFSFSGLPDGAYFVIAQIKETRPANGGSMVAMQRVEVRGGQAVRLTVPQGVARVPPAATPPAPPPPPRRRTQ